MQSESTSRKIQQRCPRCGLTFYSEKPDALCPACLIATTLDAGPAPEGPAFWEDPAPARPAHHRTFSHFEILDELGRGGMGVVYRARDINTERIVALKVLQAHHLEVPDLVQRFRSEVRAVSSLDHVHVLPIHEVGEHDGIPFFSMKLTTGQSLAHRIGNYLGKPREAAQLLAKISRGVQHAHERGILHRDLKPGNILLDAAGEPFVCDFGLAKWIEEDKKLTVTAAVLGTPHYIAPEQASGSKALTTAVDIYSLGAILYELLTGRPPFVGGTVLETLLASQDHAPERPSSIARNVPRDLETICLKALQREPAARYSTAAALADDLENWLAGRSINARPVSSGEQLWRWAKRNPLPAALASSLLLVLVVTAIGALYSAEKLKTSLARAVSAESASKERLYQSLVAQARATRRTGTAGQRFLAMEALRQAAAVRKDPELRAEVIAALSLYDLEVQGRWTVRENALKQPIRFNGDLSRLYVADVNGDVEVHDLKSGANLMKLSGEDKAIQTMVASGHSYLAARTQNDEILIWKEGVTAPVFHLLQHPMVSRGARWAFDFVFSDDDRRFGTVGKGGVIEVYDTRDWRLEKSFKVPLDRNIIAFSRGAHLLAVTGTECTEVVIYDLETGNLVSQVTTPAAPQNVDWNFEGTLLAVGCSDYNIYLVDRSRSAVVKTLSGHRQDITQVRFSHTGGLLASTARDETTRLWDTTSSSQQVVLNGFGGEAAIEFSADDSLLSTTDYQRDVAVVRVHGAQKSSVTADPPFAHDFATLTSSLDCSADNVIATASFRGVTLYRSSDLQVLSRSNYNISGPIVPKLDEKSVRFLPDGKMLVSIRESSPEIFNLDSTPSGIVATKVGTLDIGHSYILGSSPPFPSRYLCFTSQSESKGLIFDLLTNSVVRRIDKQPFIWDLVCDPKLNWFAAGYSGNGPDSTLVWTDKTSQTPFRSLASGASGLLSVNPSGSLLMTTGYRGGLLWETSTWTEANHFKALSSDANSVSFSHDGKTVAISTNHSVELYDIATRQRLVNLETTMNNPRLIFSPSDNLLIGQGVDNSLTAWNIVFIRKQLSLLGLDWN